MLTRALRTGSAAIAVFALALMVAVPANAQMPEAEAEEIPQDELELFAEIYLEADEIRQELDMQVAAADSPEEAQQIQEEANQRMMQVIEDHGMSLERYQEVTHALNADPEQHQAFLAVLEEIEGPGN